MNDGLFKSFKKGQYTLSVEYLRFMKRIDSSIQSLACVSGSIWSKIMKNTIADIPASLDPLVTDDIILDGTLLMNLLLYQSNVENEINKCADNRDRNIIKDIDPTGRLSKLYDDNLPTFTIPEYYYRIVICLVLHALMKPTVSAETIEKHVNVLNKIELNETERAIVSFAQVCHLPFTQAAELPSSYQEVFNQVLACIERVAREQPSSPLPYHQVAKCAKLYEYLRTVSLLLIAPLTLMSKPKKAAFKVKLHKQIEALQSNIRMCREVISKFAADYRQEKCVDYMNQIVSMLDNNCTAIL